MELMGLLLHNIAASKNSMDILHEIDRLDNIPSNNKSQNRVQYHNIAARREKDFKKEFY